MTDSYIAGIYINICILQTQEFSKKEMQNSILLYPLILSTSTAGSSVDTVKRHSTNLSRVPLCSLQMAFV